jgi:hypothetical protein
MIQVLRQLRMHQHSVNRARKLSTLPLVEGVVEEDVASQDSFRRVSSAPNATRCHGLLDRSMSPERGGPELLDSPKPRDIPSLKSLPFTNYSDVWHLLSDYVTTLFPGRQGAITAVTSLFQDVKDDHPDLAAALDALTRLESSCSCLLRSWRVTFIVTEKKCPPIRMQK